MIVIPRALTFSFSRAIQQPALEIWQGKEANISKAQQALLHRVQIAIVMHAVVMTLKSLNSTQSK